jgi:hypothetical protein
LNSSWCGVQLWRLLFLQDHDFHFCLLWGTLLSTV